MRRTIKYTLGFIRTMFYIFCFLVAEVWEKIRNSWIDPILAGFKKDESLP